MVPALDKRLSAVAGMVRDGAIVADIGTDHAYLAAHLINSGISPHVYACDINSAPLARAQETVTRCGLQDKISLRLSNGLQALPEGCAQDIVIAGMGGELVADIIAGAGWLKNPQVHLILQPMTRPEHLRHWLFTNGYDILKEQGVHIGRHYYTVMLACYTGARAEPDDLLMSVGRLTENTDKDSIDYLKHYIQVLCRILSGLEQGKTDENQLSIERYKALVNDIQAALNAERTVPEQNRT